MGARKRNKAEQMKEAKKATYTAVLRNCPSSPRKMRLVADLIRGENVNRALDILRYNAKDASKKLEKLVMSAISNWQVKNENVRLEDSNLVVKEIFVDQAKMLKRIQPAPQGRAYRIRKRSNHVTVILDNLNNESETAIKAPKVEQSEKIEKTAKAEKADKVGKTAKAEKTTKAKKTAKVKENKTI